MYRIITLLSAMFLLMTNEVVAKPEDSDIHFHNGKINFQGHEIALGPHAFYIDGRLTDAEAARQPYVFNSINEAAKHLTDGTEKEPMTLYIAPWVYWIDNPDDPACTKLLMKSPTCPENESDEISSPVVTYW